MEVVVVALLILYAATTPVSSQPSLALPGCPSKCGDVEVPYPFGTRDGCARDESFLLTCNETHYSPPKLFKGNINITSISLSDGYTGVMLYIGRNCYNSTGGSLNTGFMSSNLSNTPFTVSADRNRFTATGCDTLAYIVDPSEKNGFWTGCSSMCKNLSYVENGTCSGIGCCQTSIPKGLKYYRASFQTYYYHIRVWNFNPCSYAFVVDKDAFVFNTSILVADYTYKSIKLPAVFDWSIEGNGDCETAQRIKTSYACVSTDSNCSSSRNGLGYLCHCSQGYEGNPYLVGGCKDIDECQDQAKYSCKGVCSNTPGGYNCICPLGSHSDDPKTERCVDDPVKQKFPSSLKLVIGLGCSVLFFITLSYWTYWIYQKRKFIQLKQKFFKQNGGRFLQQCQKATSFKILTESNIIKARNKYNELLGKGGNGEVYKGALDDGRIVAIKIPTKIDERKINEFAKELYIISQINHKNVVKILGCCLEVRVPILVYEYIPRGTLFQYLHTSNLPISFSTRLRIATESADALFYLHSAADPPILHWDVKSSNILLDENYTAKVSDFGTSILAPSDVTLSTEVVQGTPGYLDPECFETGKLTEKSDVYSFGVVLVELFTRKTALSLGEPATNFVICMDEDRILEILDPDIVQEAPSLNILRDIAKLIERCLRDKGVERPTMREVFIALETLRGTPNYYPVAVKPTTPEERESLLGEASGTKSYDSSTFFSLEIQAVEEIDNGR